MTLKLFELKNLHLRFFHCIYNPEIAQLAFLEHQLPHLQRETVLRRKTPGVPAAGRGFKMGSYVRITYRQGCRVAGLLPWKLFFAGQLDLVTTSRRDMACGPAKIPLDQIPLGSRELHMSGVRESMAVSTTMPTMRVRAVVGTGFTAREWNPMEWWLTLVRCWIGDTSNSGSLHG